MIPAYQNAALDDDNRTRRRVIKTLDKAYTNTEDVIVSGVDLSEDAGSGFKALEKKLLLFISLTLEAQADIEQEEGRDSVTNNTYDGENESKSDNELVVPQITDPTLSEYDNDSVVPIIENPIKQQRGRRRRQSEIPRRPLTITTRGKARQDRDENRMRSPGRRRSRAFSPNPVNIRSPQGLSGGAIAYQHSGMFAGILKNMLTVLQDISSILVDMANSFDFLNKEQVFRLATLLKRAKNEFTSLVYTFDNLVTHSYMYNRKTKETMLIEVQETLEKAFGKLGSMINMYSPAFVRMKAPDPSEMTGGGYSLGYGIPRRML